MAGHLLRAGNELTVWNRTPEKAEGLRASGARVALTLSEVGRTCDAVFLCVRATEDVRECLSELAMEAAPGTLFVDHSTILPQGAIEFHEWLRGLGMRFVDAPITGGSMGARKGQLTIFCGGDLRDTTEVIELAHPYAKRAERVGGPGAGQWMKMANQIAVGGALIALCESLCFAEKAGLELSQTLELLGGGAAGSWAFENYGPKVLQRDWSPGFTIDNQVKDFVYCSEAAKSIGASIPCTELVRDLLAEMQSEGKGGLTTAALFEKLCSSQPER